MDHVEKCTSDSNSEITSVIWLKNRILCAGWNRHVTEFADTETGIHKKNWETRHTEDVLCAAVNYPQALATGSYNGDIVLWRLETGQPYRRYQASDPKRRCDTGCHWIKVTNCVLNPVSLQLHHRLQERSRR